MASTARACIAFFLWTLAAVNLSGCNDPFGNSGSSSGATSTPNNATSSGLSISGNPAQTVEVGATYEFRPATSSAGGVTLSFTIQNQPSWTSFNPATGMLSGTPTAANVGNSAPIVISVSDGSTTTALAAFSIAVTQGTGGVATLSWTSPPASAAGTMDIAGYHIYYGDQSNNLTHMVDVADPASTSYVIGDLASGTWYFGITSYNASHIESTMSAIVPVTI